jgi:cell division protein FtsB
MKKEKVPYIIFENLLEKNHSLQSKIYWQETFIEYIKENNVELYKEARKFTDDLEANDYFTEEDKKKWGIK